ncbi:MAG: hypothetical protein ABH864_04500 [archaeon]
MPEITQKKTKLAVATRRTKWAPFWAVIRKFGAGHRTHPSAITKQRRHWRRTKLKITPRKVKREHLG